MVDKWLKKFLFSKIVISQCVIHGFEYKENPTENCVTYMFLKLIPLDKCDHVTKIMI